MKTILLFVGAVLCMQAHAQFPYFLQNHNGNNIRYGSPVDIEYDGPSALIYSLHFSNPGPGALIARYNANTGVLVNPVVYLTRGNATIKPVRVRTLGTNYYVLFNAATGTGVSGFCLVSINAGSNAVNWSRAFTVPTGAALRNAVDFVLDGGQFAYILSNAFNAGTSQNDIAVTKVDITAPALVWDNVYQNTTRSEAASNIIVRPGTPELLVSAISSDFTTPLDRGPVLLRISTGGGYLGSMLYKYNPGCNNAEPNGTWITPSANSFFLSSTSIESGSNGPLWLASINPATLAINFQSNHRTVSAYLNPEIQPVFTAAGTELLISGSSPVSSAYGYLHLQFSTLGLPFTRGMIYPSTNPFSYGSPMFDVYKNTGVGLNIFSVAENSVTGNNYHLLKTDDMGRNDCEDPYTVTPDICAMSQYGINFAQVPVALIMAAPVCNTTFTSNSLVQLCNVPFFAAPGDDSKSIRTAVNGELAASPNPTKGIFTLSAGKSSLSEIQIINADGKIVPADVTETSEGVQINLAGKKAGIYVAQVLVNGEMKHVRIVLE